MSLQTVKEVLERAAQLMERPDVHLHRGEYADGMGGFCTMGAVRQAAFDDVFDRRDVDQLVYENARVAIKLALGYEPDTAYYGGDFGVALWNDHGRLVGEADDEDGTPPTKEEVIAVLRKAKAFV